MAKRRSAARAAPTLPGLTLHSISTEADELLRERERLLRDVSKKKQQLEQARAAAERAHDEATIRMQPLVERHDALIEDLTALFDELLAEGRLTARARTAVMGVRSSLELQGILPFARDPDEPDFDEPDFDADLDEPDFADEDEPGEGPQSGSAPNAEREVPSARQPGREARTLREIFRALVRLVHPDHARQEQERVRRTEVMKEITRAFEQGDLARLIELERAWRSERVLAGDGDPEARCRELERINRELAAQAKALAQAIRATKRETKSQLAPLDEVLVQASSELDDIAAIREFVTKFRDGKLSLAEFARGPLNPSTEPEAPRPKRRRKR